MYFLRLTWNQNCPIANFGLKVLKVLIWEKTLEKIYEVLHAMIKKEKKKFSQCHFYTTESHGMSELKGTHPNCPSSILFLFASSARRCSACVFL